MSQLHLVSRAAMSNPDVTVLEAAGSLDLNTVDQFEAAFNAFFRKGQYRIILDLAKLDYISSAGIGVLVGNIKDIRKNRGDIKLSNIHPNVYRVFELMDLFKIFHSHASEREAVMAF